MLKLGISTLSRGIFTSREAYVSVAQAAERAGFDFFSVNDHIVVPAKLGSAYPYTPGGVWSAAEQGHCFEQLTLLAFLAGCTERLRLLTSVMVVPHRDPLLAAKAIATADVLSGGRVILGVGAGWMEEEFRLLKAPFEARGQATDEYIAAWKALWTEERPSYQGVHVSLDNLIFEPKPLQKPHPPIWVGGESRAALRRAVTLGDAWYPGNNNQQKPMDTPVRLAAGRAELQRAAERHGRDPSAVRMSLIVQNPFQWSPVATQDGTARRFFTGSSADMLADCAALDALGIDHVAIRAGGRSVAEAIENIERFGAEVIRGRDA